MKSLKIFLTALLAFWITSQDSLAQCTSSDIMEPGFNFITSSRGCAPFTIEIQTLFLNSTPGTIYHVDWGDGSPGQDYIQVNNYPNGPIIVHEYKDAPVSCGYQLTIEVENPCNPLGSVDLEPINVIVWTEDLVFSAPDVYRVCQGFASSINFNDNSDWNCFPRADARENADPRWVQWVYGHSANGNRIPNIRVDGVSPGGFPYYNPATGNRPVYPVTGVDQVSLNVQIPATAPADIGKDFYVTLKNWNTCNAYDENLSNGALNPVTPGGDNPPRVSESRIVVVAAPTPDFVARKENSSGIVAWDYCIGDIIYFDNESTGAAGSSLRYTWEFYDGPDAADGLLDTKTNKNPVFSFSSGGPKLVRLIVRDNNAVGSCNSIVEKIVRITPTSIAQISASNTKFCKTPGSDEVFSVTFNDVSIGSTINTEWKWEFYDENNNLIREEPNSGYSTAVPVPYTQEYGNPGVYRVVLISRDIVTLCDTRDELNIVVYNNPEPSFVSTNVCEGLQTELIDQTTLQKIKDSQVVRLEWDFDYDNVTFNPDSVFDGAWPDTLRKEFNYGIYQVALRATNDQAGCSAIFTDNIEIYQNPTATFTKDSIQGCSPLNVTLNNTSAAVQQVNMLEYVWRINYGNGFVDTLRSDPNDPNFSPAVSTIFENWSITKKTFQIELEAISEDGCITNSLRDSLMVLPSIKPGFYYADYEPLANNCAPLEVNFQVNDFTRSLLPDSYIWTVRNEEGVIRRETINAETSQFNHVFTATGNGIRRYSVGLQTSLPDMCVADSTILINVNPVPTSDFTIDTLEFGCEKMVLEIDANQKGLLEYTWTINKGGLIFLNKTFGDNFMYEVARPGPTMPGLELSFDLQTANYAFCQSDDMTSQALTVPPQPQLNAKFQANPEFQVFPNNIVTITNISSESDAVYFWDFGDGTTRSEKNPDPHSYENAGIYKINLKLEESYCESYDSVNIVIQPATPIADFSFDPGEGCAPLTVNFTNLSKYGDPDLYHWYFGQGEGESFDEHPKHTYYEPGVYSVKLEATNESGITDAAVKRLIIEVFPNPHADFAIRPETVKLPEDPIYVTNLSFEGDNYFWDFGDGTNSMDFEPTHIYTDTGRYDITLITTTDKGCADTVIYENIVEVIDGNEIQIPNAFTPSLDGPTGGSRYAEGRNDVFYPVTEGVIAYNMQIFNRWGELLFATSDTNLGWDGYYKGKLCAPDVYIYKIDFKFIDGREVMKFGDVVLIR